ncbi:PREDICTED: uncharacterized protein LOC108361093 [Rhagoletis zephyria]|uniref:uncharacterized protein LOC108361093 n=1 Tax=Rhagoletis zephyria TaxID=28612 RepID=UPI000811936A|nr:PREDICTED: uncharacterized protein LOC108361093 [Rhagoletis zephyria]
MNVLYIWSLIYFAINTVFGKITVNKVIVRIPRPNDIGLIFDLTVINAPCKEREALEFRIRSDGTCSVNVTECITMKNAGRVVGGNFGLLDAGAAEVVSLIWPTVSLYNRVGSCPIIVTAKNIRNIEEHQKHTIHFDTRFTTLDPEGHTLRKRPDYKDCKNWDKEYLKNCTPVNCEERYFGQRSFYNETTQHCDEVPACDKPNMIYNFYTNECFIPENFFTAEDLKKIQSGDFVDENAHEEEIAQAKTQASMETHTCDKKYQQQKQNQQRKQHQQQQQQHADFKRAVDDFDEEFKNLMESKFFDTAYGGGDGAESTQSIVKTEKTYMPYWLKGILEGLAVVGAIIFLQVLATVAIYVLICFVIFLIVTWISRRQFKCNADTSCVLRSPTASDGGDEPLITPSSLLSQR